MNLKDTRREFIRKTALAGAGLPLMGAALPGTGKTIPGFKLNESSWKINLFSKHLQFLGYSEMAGTCLEAGLDGVDLTVRPGGHVLPENVERDLPLAVHAVRDAGLELTMMTTRITDPDDPFTELILDRAADLGIKYYRLGYYRYDPQQDIEENLDRIRRQMNGLTRLNEKYGIHGAYQNHAGNYFGAPLWDLWEVLRDLDPQWMGCQYDIRHATAEGSRSWPLALELLKYHIRCMVIKDFKWVEEKGTSKIRNVPIGEGMVDFRDYFDRLVRYGISGPISLHIEYPLYPEEETDPVAKKRAAMEAIVKDVKILRGLLPS